MPTQEKLVSSYARLAEQAREGDTSGALGAAIGLLRCLLDPPGTPELAEAHARAFLTAMGEDE